MSRLKKGLALVLTLCMMLSVMPVITPSSQAANGDDFYKIVHLDCGRKYFTVGWIKGLIDEMAKDGYTHLELAFGNDGLRFLLDDMSVTVGDTTYASGDVKDGIMEGNKAYYNFGTNELIEDEMDGIIAHAKDKGIEIIPLLNSPGHMDAIITCMSNLGISNASYNGSDTTVDLSNSTAVTFTQNLVKKYAEYFADKGCTVFNMGCDEYANDIYTVGSMGFGNLVSTGKYGNFVTYVNNLATIVKTTGMTPMAFNDGFYFNGNTSSGTFDTDIMISFWTSGWQGYQSETAKKLAARGHKMVNTNGDFYYVLGKNDNFDRGSSYAANWDNAKFMGTTFDSEQAGSMFCIWCDYPNAETENEIYTKVVESGVLAAMSEAMGHMPESGGSTDPEDTTVKDTATGVSVTAPGLTSIEVIEQPAVKSDNTVSKTYSITLNGGDYTDEATVKIPYDKAFDGCTNFVGTVDSDPFKVERDGSYFVATVPHFSDVTITGTLADAGDPEDTVTSGGGTAASYVLDTNRLDDDAQYLIVYQASSSATSGKALNTSKGSLDVTISDSKATPSGDASAALWTYKKERSGLFKTSYYLINGSNYLYPSRSWSGGGQYNLNITTSKESVTISNQGSGAYSISNSNAYVAYSNNAWGAQSSSQNLYFYKYTPGTASYKVEPDLQESRITALTVTNDGYTDDSWNAYENALDAATAKLSEVKNANYSSQDKANDALNELIVLVNKLETSKSDLKKAVTITINYQTEDGTTVKTETRKVAEGTATIELSNVTGTDGKTYVPTDTSLSLVNGQTEYTVTVTEMPFDPSTVTPLTIEYWITNGRPTYNSGEKSYSVSAADAYSEAGVDISTLLPANTTKDGRTLEYWCGRLLDKELSNSSTSGKQEQTETSGDDETLSGFVFTKVRYWNGEWQVYTTDWVTVETNHQLVAYYMEVVDIKNSNGQSELHVNAADWGTKGDGTGNWGYTPESSRCSVSVQIVYEDGTTNPPTTTAYDLKSKTFVYGYWAGGRGLGTMIFNGQQNYQIYKVTAETGDMTSSTSGNYVTVTDFSWDSNEETVWEGNATQSVSIGNPARNPSYEAPYDNLTWNTTNHNRNNAILIRVYVRTVATESALTVHYVDQTAHTEFYNYNIAVEEGTTFNTGFGLGSEKNTLVNNTVVNYNGVSQTVTADLSAMPEIGAQYRYSDYTCVQVVRSEAGKDVYLYYTFSNTHNFVIDFGLPLKITTTDLDISGNWTSASISGAQYGTATANAGEGVTYTPTKTLKGVETLQLTLTGQNTETGRTESATHTIYIYPATTVYYEEGFASYSGNGWTDTDSKGSGTQTAQIAGQSSDEYGYDAKYANENSGPSNGTEAISGENGAGDKATFNFTGTGVDIYANCSPDTGAVMIKVKQGENTVKAAQVLTALKKGITGATQNQDKTGNNVPIASFTGLDYGSYTVEITHIKTTANETVAPVKLDGFRVYGTLENQDNDIYKADLEDNPTFIELRDKVLVAVDINGYCQKDDSGNYVNQYADQIAKNVYSQVLATGSPNEGTVSAVILSDNTAITNSDTLEDLLKNGPKNEIYLQPSQSLVFTVNTNREVQIGLKALDKATLYTISKNSDAGTQKTLNSSTDMFYTVLNKGTTGEQTITITNKGDGILSITKLKICDDPNATLGTLTAEDLIPALVSLGFETTSNGSGGSSGGGGGGSSTPAEPTEPTTPPTETGLPFTDVTTGDWFLDNVKYVYEKGLMNGTSDTAFSPQQTTNRAMIVTILHRLENSPAMDAQSPFADVAADQYYATPVAWAAANGIVTGTSETTFAPLNNITREQMAAILYRYAQFKGYDVSVGEDTNILSYADAETISEYAVPAIQWAVGSGLINGKGGGVLDPQGSATRAEVSAILARFCEAYAK